VKLTARRALVGFILILTGIFGMYLAYKHLTVKLGTCSILGFVYPCLGYLLLWIVVAFGNLMVFLFAFTFFRSDQVFN